MAKRKRLRVWMLPSPGPNAKLFLLLGFFVLGSGVGTLLAGRLGNAAESALGSYLNEWAGQLEQGSAAQATWLSALVHLLRFPAAVFVLGSVPLGVLAIPALFFVRGLLLSFTAASFLKYYAYRGVVAALLLYGPWELLSLVIQFLAGAFAFRVALERAFRPEKLQRQAVSRPGPVLLCGGLLLAASWLQYSCSGLTARLICNLIA